MTSAAKYPEGFQLGKCNSLYEETKGTASFRMYPDTTGKKVHIEVWTPDMARRKQKCVAKGTELSTVVYYYQIFVDYSPRNSTKAQLIYLAPTPIAIDGEYNAKIGIPTFNRYEKIAFNSKVVITKRTQSVKLCTERQAEIKKEILKTSGQPGDLEFEKLASEYWHLQDVIMKLCVIEIQKMTTKFEKGGLVSEMIDSMEEIGILPAAKMGGGRLFELKKDGKLTVVPSDGDTIDGKDIVCFYKTKNENNLSGNILIDVNSRDVSDIGQIGDVAHFQMPKISFEALEPTEHPIKSMKMLLWENKHLKKAMLKAVDDLDAEKYVKALLQYEANERYIKTANEELKRITF